jgi:TRAP-type C4-dicarboxylate transport system permease small subunit
MAGGLDYNRAVERIDRLLLLIAGAALILMMVHISFDVASNQIFGAPVPLTNAVVTQYYMICVAYLPLAAAEYRGAHIRVDFVVNLLPKRPRRVAEGFAQLLSAALYLALALQSWQLALERLGRNAFLMEQTTRVTIWPSYFIIPVGFALVAALLLLRFACRLLGRPEPEAPAVRADGAGHV